MLTLRSRVCGQWMLSSITIISSRKKKSLIKKVSFLARFDYMGNNSDELDEDGIDYIITDHERKRVYWRFDV